jgi:Flp pilus assembly protein CpaB
MSSFTVPHRLSPRWRRRLARIRRPVAAGLLTLAVLSGARAVLAPAGPETTVLVAVRDLPAGHHLSAGDVRPVNWLADSVPDGVVDAPEGRVLSSPLRRGEPVTDARLNGSGALSGQPPGTVAMPIRLSDPGIAVWLHPGDHVDVLAAPGAVGDVAPAPPLAEAEVLVDDAVVLGIGTEGRQDSSSWGSSGNAASSWTAEESLMVAVDRAEASRLAMGTGRLITVVITEGASPDGTTT